MKSWLLSKSHIIDKMTEDKRKLVNHRSELNGFYVVFTNIISLNGN